MSVLDCCNPCATVQTVNIPGAQGDPGLPGIDGTTGSMGDITFTRVTPDPAGNTSNNAQLMMGLGATITPVNASSSVIIIVTGVIQTTPSHEAQIQIWYGSTFPAPANGDSTSGTAVGAIKHITGDTGSMGFCLSAVVTGLIVGVPYWIDVGLARVTNTNISVNKIADVDVVAMES